MGEPIDPVRYKGVDRDAMLANLHDEIVKQTVIAERIRRKA